MTPLLVGGNVFLKLAQSRLLMFLDRRQWLRWELECFDLLHGCAFRSGAVDSWELWFDELPGESCRDLLARGALTPACLAAAARELHRAHQLPSPNGAPLSHGDPHLGNMIYDAARACARLADFEQKHEDGVDTLWRRADDLLVFTLDLLGRAPEPDWPGLAVAFLGAYPEPAVIRALRGRLTPPSGFEAILWLTRTGQHPRSFVSRRLEELVRAL